MFSKETIEECAKSGEFAVIINALAEARSIGAFEAAQIWLVSNLAFTQNEQDKQQGAA